MDSGASQHVTSQLSNLSFSQNYESPDDIVIGDGLDLQLLIMVLLFLILVFLLLMFYVFNLFRKIWFMFLTFVIPTILL